MIRTVARPDDFRSALVLTGPTGSGKSALALELAERIGAEIVAMDSMTLYRGLDIGTAKPGVEDRRRVSHHLIDVLDPWETGSVAWWLERARECVREIEARGRRALFVGGTPLYLKALLSGLFEGPPADADVRARLSAEVEAVGVEALHAKLAAVDQRTADRLHPNDVRRVTRALEVWEVTGRPMSEWQTQWGANAHPQAAQVLCLQRPREELYARINQRVLDLVAGGWLDEVRALRTLPRPLSREAGLALGYRELNDFLDEKRGWDETVSLIQQRTRNFAKRQLTWFRHLPEVEFRTPELTREAWFGKMI
jgi:tRNA dimethylallyltransferase